jgi:hypothetical protein
MRRSKDELLKYILELENTDELYKLKFQLETQPFCGVEQCYDLERFIFHLITIEQRQLIIEHIARISTDIEKKIHIFTTYDYFNQCSEKIKYFLKVNSDFITIINSKSEVYEIGLRNVNNDKVSFISDMDLRIDQKGAIPNVSELDELDQDMVSQSLADLYLRTILNYTEIFPEFVPLFIDFATNANTILAYKLYDAREHKNIAGCILDNSLNTVPDRFENNDFDIYFFKSENAFMKIFVNNILK